MINKIYKRIHNKYLNIFKFFFFLRYVFAIFIISTSLFLLIPKLFDYEKKIGIIKEYLLDQYNLTINNYSTVKFKVFPTPNLLLKNVNLKLKDQPVIFNSESINIFLNLKNIYNYKNFTSKKVILKKTEIFLNIEDTKYLVNYFGTLKKKLSVKYLNLNLQKNEKRLIEIKDIHFSNFGYQRYHIFGEIFDKKFKSSLTNNNKNLNFKLLKTGFKANFDFKDQQIIDSLEGSSKINLLNSLLKFDFNLNDNAFKVTKSNFRNKYLTFSLNSYLKFDPFFQFDSKILISELDKHLVGKINLNKLIKNKDIIKKLDGKINISYNNKKFFTDLFENYSSDINLAYGRLVFSNEISIIGGAISCQASSVLTDEFPRLNFVCTFNLQDKKKLFKKLSISKNINNDPISLNIEGSLNLLNKKINFNKINIDQGYTANTEDIKYFKDAFERILFNEGFFKIFNKNKIKEFLIEII